jgi:hypothetical protein
MENLKQRLLNGEILDFESIEGDMMSVRHKKALCGNMHFMINLNCKVIKMTKTFNAFKKKFDQLVLERNLLEV